MISGGVTLGSVMVQTTSYRGASPEEIADRAVAKILYVGETSHPVIRDQAVAFKEKLRELLIFYIKEAIESDRATIALRLKDAGFPELVNLLD